MKRQSAKELYEILMEIKTILMERAHEDEETIAENGLPVLVESLCEQIEGGSERIAQLEKAIDDYYQDVIGARELWSIRRGEPNPAPPDSAKVGEPPAEPGTADRYECSERFCGATFDTEQGAMGHSIDHGHQVFPVRREEGKT